MRLSRHSGEGATRKHSRTSLTILEARMNRWYTGVSRNKMEALSTAAVFVHGANKLQLGLHSAG
jgi:hypothetical protein